MKPGSDDEFGSSFEALTGNEPFPWQRALYEVLVSGQIPRMLDIPTGLGKTSIIAIWLLALGRTSQGTSGKALPRRLAYVVNRRTVVDQATREAERLRGALLIEPRLRGLATTLRSLAAWPAEVPLAISTLRGQFADNAEWRTDPSRPAVIVGTVDMIGSRLLFAGYGCGFKSRPLHAGFLGQDTLLVHDEAHLEPAFQELIEAVEAEQLKCRDIRPLRIVALTATSRWQGVETAGITEADRRHPVVGLRIGARKGIAFDAIADQKRTAEKIGELSLAYSSSGGAILVFLRKLEDVEKVTGLLRSNRQAVQVLTGTLRGLERDALAKDDPVFARFMPRPTAEPKKGTVYLVCTSAGEVGVDISADHLVCDLTPLDSMSQRFGRVNRFGKGDAHIDVVHPLRSGGKGESPPGGSTEDGTGAEATAETAPGESKAEPSLYEGACLRTLHVLMGLAMREDERRDASPAALRSLPDADRRGAYTPAPTVLPTSDILFDAWALTSVRDKLPGRPPVADWLHGVADWEPPETHVAWRQEVSVISRDLAGEFKPSDLLEDYPLKPHELLRDRSDRVLKQLEKLAERSPVERAWLLDGEGSVIIMALGDLVAAGRQRNVLHGRTVLLPPEVGGLAGGMLDGGALFDPGAPYDVADRWADEGGEPRRARVWDDEPSPRGMRLIRTIDTQPEGSEEGPEENGSTPTGRFWNWYSRPRSADDDGSRTATEPQLLLPHLLSAEHFATQLADRLELEKSLAAAVVHATRRHDLGKNRAVWQRSVGNRGYPAQVLAKSGGRMRPLDLNAYRHELGSLLDLEGDTALHQLGGEVQDLVYHLVAAHHGRARPLFPAEEAFDPERPEEAAVAAAAEVPRRFIRLQRKYGRWGLAYLESLVRAADALASQAGTQEVATEIGLTARRPEEGTP